MTKEFLRLKRLTNLLGRVFLFPYLYYVGLTDVMTSTWFDCSFLHGEARSWNSLWLAPCLSFPIPIFLKGDEHSVATGFELGWASITSRCSIHYAMASRACTASYAIDRLIFQAFYFSANENCNQLLINPIISWLTFTSSTYFFDQQTRVEEAISFKEMCFLPSFGFFVHSFSNNGERLPQFA